MLLSNHTQLVVEGVMPGLLMSYVIPVGRDAMLNRVQLGDNTSLGLDNVSLHMFFLTRLDTIFP